MFLVTAITGNVGGATARHVLANGHKVRGLLRNPQKAAIWADQGVELVHGDWHDPTAIATALKDADGAFVMLPAEWAPSPDFKEAKAVIANYVDALNKAAPPRVIALSSIGANYCVNARWMDLGVKGSEHVAGATPARNVFAAAQKSVQA